MQWEQHNPLKASWWYVGTGKIRKLQKRLNIAVCMKAKSEYIHF